MAGAAGGVAGFAAAGAGGAGFAAAGAAGGFTGSTLIGVAGLVSSGWTARAIWMGGLASGETPGGGRSRIACGRAMAGATPGGGRKTTRPLDPPPVIPPGVVGISNRRLVPRVPSRAERSIDTDASPRIAGAAGLPVLTPSAIAGETPNRNAAAVKATGAQRLDVRSSASLPDAANLMRFTFRPPHILRWPILRSSYSRNYCARR